MRAWTIAALAAMAATAEAAPATLWLDYFHTGGRGVEIFAVDRISQEPLPWPGSLERSTPVAATYDAFGSERHVLTFDNHALRDVAAWAPYEFVTILVNGATYGGGGIFGAFATVAVDSEWSEYLFVQEFGHHFAGLADEYYSSPVAYEPVAQVVEPWEANVTALLDCVMFTRNEVPFCRVCQRALEQVIDLYAGPRRRD